MAYSSESTPHSEYDRMVIAARKVLGRGDIAAFELSPAALQLAEEMGIDPAVIRTHFLLVVYNETLRRR
ncbi:hypothetical protein ABT061_16000 [Streptosporangium sp. NPDC002544]|uniref:hypothetical protein n=1 Tax=Streptosporangium sp. NPDC002544 TaxID=3154538 RepID=UPI0033311026